MDVDGDRSFSSDDLEKLENADDVSTNHNERTNQLGVCVCWGEKVNGRYYLIGARNMICDYTIGW